MNDTNIIQSLKGLRKFKPYSAYKDSGVEWLGDIPAHWELKKIRRITQSHKQGFYTEQAYIDAGVKLARITDIDDFGRVSFDEMPFVEIPAREERLFKLEEGDVLFARSGTIGRFGIVRKPGRSVFASYLIRFRFESVESEFLLFALSSHFFKESLLSTLHGGANQNVHAENIKEQLIALPPTFEQRVIAAFLDRETAKIDTLVAKKELLIELLQEKRAALITRAVTKGLDSNVPMKDSGVDWLGEIPAHWEVKTLRWLLSVRSGDALSNTEFELTASDERSIPVIGGNGVMGFGNRSNTDAPCIAVGRVGALCGNVHLVNPPAWVTDNALLLSDFRGFDRHYLAAIVKALNLNQWASQSAQPLITGGFLKAQRVCCPPLPEQTSIMQRLQIETPGFNELIERVREAIAHLNELRTALISAAVTGKIDVRD